MAGRRRFFLNGVILLCVCVSGCCLSPAETAEDSYDHATPDSAGTVRLDEMGIEQVWVPPGSFLMGTDSESIDGLLAQGPPGFVAGEFSLEQPQHEVRITRGYWIDKFEVTNAAFRAFKEDGGYTNRAYWSDAGWRWQEDHLPGSLPRACMENLPDRPVACISWYEAEAYAAWRGGRLPTEAEWEYAARGPASNVYPWGDEFKEDLCNLVDATDLQPVGSYPQGVSWVGAQDMAGNVMEWVQDWLGPHPTGPVEDPAGPETGEIKVEKGGWWGATFFVGRSAYRHFEDPPTYGDAHIGFRIVSQ